MDVNDKVFRNNSILVFSNVFRAQLHFSCLDVVASLNKSCVEHYAEHHFVRKSCMLKDKFDVSLERYRLLLLFGQKKDHAVFFLAVKFICRVHKLFPNI